MHVRKQLAAGKQLAVRKQLAARQQIRKGFLCMYMVIGGAYQGKLGYASDRVNIPADNFLHGESAGADDIFRAEGIVGFHLYVRRFLMDMDEEELDAFAEKLYEENPDIVIVTDEIGSGVVPLEPEERRYREAVGRVCTDLAARADRVDRVVCGIGTVIKSGQSCHFGQNE